jgi:hypothetical protein
VGRGLATAFYFPRRRSRALEERAQHKAADDGGRAHAPPLRVAERAECAQG